MALGSCACCTPYCNLHDNPPATTAEPSEVTKATQGSVQDLAESASTAGSKSGIAPSYANTPTPSCNTSTPSCSTSTPVPAPVPAPISTEKLFKYFMKTYKTSVKVLEQNGGQAGQTLTPPNHGSDP